MRTLTITGPWPMEPPLPKRFTHGSGSWCCSMVKYFRAVKSCHIGTEFLAAETVFCGDSLNPYIRALLDNQVIEELRPSGSTLDSMPWKPVDNPIACGLVSVQC